MTDRFVYRAGQYKGWGAGRVVGHHHCVSADHAEIRAS